MMSRIDMLADEISDLQRRVHELELKASMQPKTEQVYFSQQQFAKLLNCSVQTVQNKIKAGEIEAVKVGSRWRIPARALSNFKGLR